MSNSFVEEMAPAIDMTVLVPEDLRTVKYICDLKNNRPGVEIDDIDHLGNRRFARLANCRINSEWIGSYGKNSSRASKSDKKAKFDTNIVNSKPVNAAVKSSLVLLSCLSLWIKLILYLRSRISVVSPHWDLVV